MGLDTTHDCWHGPYSAFMRWRVELHRLLNPEETGDPYDNLRAAWGRGRYDDQTVPINVLMNHSDCDGDIPVEVCGPLADALEVLLPQMPERALYDSYRPATERFIRGLRRAAAAGQPVHFR